MPNLTYSTGTVSVGPGDTEIVGSGTIWTAPNAKAFDRISIGGIEVTVPEFPATNRATIEPWPGEAIVNQPYKLFQVSPLRFTNAEIAGDTSRIVAALNKDGFYHFVGPDEAEPDPSLGDDGQYARQASTGKEWLKIGGEWVFQGLYGPLNFDESQWSHDTTYAAKIVVPRNGKLYRSKEPLNLNHPPESSPSWWELFLAGGDRYDLHIGDTDQPLSGEELLTFPIPTPLFLPTFMSDSIIRVRTAPAGDAVFSIRKALSASPDSSTEVATVTFAAGSRTAVMNCPSTVNFARGDLLIVTAPDPKDAALFGCSGVIVLFR